MRIFDRKSVGRGHVDTVITSHNNTVRYISGRVVLTDALHALFPNMKRGSMGYLLQIIAANFPCANIEAWTTTYKKGGPIFTLDKTEFEDIATYLVLRRYEAESNRLPQEGDSRIYPQIIEGFNRWGRKWFPPFN